MEGRPSALIVVNNTTVTTMSPTTLPKLPYSGSRPRPGQRTDGRRRQRTIWQRKDEAKESEKDDEELEENESEQYI
jgi:hypothetical protein